MPQFRLNYISKRLCMIDSCSKYRFASRYSVSVHGVVENHILDRVCNVGSNVALRCCDHDQRLLQYTFRSLRCRVSGEPDVPCTMLNEPAGAAEPAKQFCREVRPHVGFTTQRRYKGFLFSCVACVRGELAALGAGLLRASRRPWRAVTVLRLTLCSYLAK